MALYLNVSNSLSELADSFCADLQQRHGDVFQPVHIITQTDGMNTWLKYQLAERLGIAANYRFLKSQDIINQVYFLLGGRSSELLSRENLVWVLFKLLGSQGFINQFGDIAAYYSNDLPDSDVKKMSLAEKIADLFDQYQVYRPDMIREWNANEDTATIKEWQQYLWHSSRTMLGERLPDRTNVSKYILEQLQHPSQQQVLESKMPVIYLFGLSIITNYHLQLYYTLGSYVDIRFFLINPSPGQYWFEDKSPKQLARMQSKGFADISEQPGNALLTSWGKVLQDTYGLLFQNDEVINAYEEIESPEPAPDTLLKKIQNDIYHNSEEVASIGMHELQDGSITINSCYSEVREVEVLYNYLVGLVDRKKEHLSPREILVMVSDINTYAPYIKAIFDNAPHKFPYSIADEGFVEGDTVSAALKSLLVLQEEELTSENVMRLLDSSFIRERFGITDIALIRDAVNKANIRFGIENQVADESAYVSWLYGLKRLMLGICMSGDEEYGDGPESLFPVELVEGAATTQLIRFYHFVEILIQSIKERDGKRTVTEWVQYVQDVLDNMVCEPESSTDEDHYRLQLQLEEYNALNEFFGDNVNYDVFSLSFLKQLDTGINSGSFFSAGITFCSLIPMRSIPFKVIAMLGLSFDKFPRKDAFVSFNLMEEKKQKGDRSTKENDKHLFLETLLSAQDYLYMSYVGQSVKDNSSIPPSVLIDEMISYIQTGATTVSNVRGVLVKKHPLHGFSRQYDQTELYTYLVTGNGKTTTLLSEEKKNEEMNFAEIPLHALISFFKDPFKGYYNDVLKIYYSDEEALLAENEIFELNGLEEWSLKHEIMEAEEEALERLRDKMVKTGKLPLKNMASVLVEDTNMAVADVRELFREATGNVDSSSIPVEIELEDTRIMGDLTLYGDRLVKVSFSKKEIKYLLEAYIQYLAARAVGLTVKLYFISAEKQQQFEAQPIDQAEACNRLKALVELYKQGHQQILAFYPQFKITPEQVEDLDADVFSKAVEGELNNYVVPCNNKYIMHEYENGFFIGPQVLEKYKHAARILLKPLDELFPGYFV